MKQAHAFLYVRSESKVHEVREPEFQVPGLFGQLPVVQTLIYLCHKYRHAGYLFCMECFFLFLSSTSRSYCIPHEYLENSISKGKLKE